jgi:hypothetical protein
MYCMYERKTNEVKKRGIRPPNLLRNYIYHKHGALVSYYVMYREEVMRAMPQYEEMKRRARKKEREAAKAAARAEEEAIGAKRQENSHLQYYSKQTDL